MHAKDLAEILRENQSSFDRVLPFDPMQDALILFDFTDNNKTLNPEMLNDTALFSDYIFNELTSRQATYGIGGYDEHRTIYSRSRLFDADHAGGEPRRLHLGIDVWGKAGIPVAAPMESEVHSFAFNNNMGDYGATIILRHQLGVKVFHTLYGHLSLDSLSGLASGMAIRQGEIFAWLGRAEENGYWPPHLHMQVIEDMEGYEGDYPGVCSLAERDQFLANCPDPDLILQMLSFVRR